MDHETEWRVYFSRLFSDWDPNSDPRVADRLEVADAGARSAGVLPDEIDAELARVADEAAKTEADALVQVLRERQSEMLRARRRGTRDTRREIRVIYGDAFDELQKVIALVEELGKGFNDAYRFGPVAAQSNRVHVLVGQLARAVVTASEIFVMLTHGFALGGRARWRTLHELAVVSATIAAGDEALADRFLLHAEVEDWQDVHAANEHTLFGRGPVTAEEAAALEARHDEILEVYGRGFARSWAWADPVTSPERATFARLAGC